MKIARAVVGRLRDPVFRRTLAIVVLTETFRSVILNFAQRLDELEDRARLGADLKALEDVATLGDLQRLETALDARYAPSAPESGHSRPQESPEAP